MKAYNTIIIGSGIVGSSIAYYLSKKNSNVLVLDMKFPTTGTSGATGAMIVVSSRQPSFYAKTALDSSLLYEELAGNLNEDIEFEMPGGMFLLYNKEQLEKAKKLVQAQNRYGINVELLDRNETLKLEPNVNPNIVGATYFKKDGMVFPMKLVKGLINGAGKRGVNFNFYNTVTSIQKINEGFIIETNKDKYFTEKVVVSAGNWTPSLCRLLGIDIPLKFVKGELMITEPLPPLLHHSVSGLRQLKNNKILLSANTRSEGGLSTATDLSTSVSIAEHSIKVLPKLKNARMTRSFAGVRPTPKDGLPILGEIPDVNNLYVAVTHSAFTLAPFIGSRMAELIMDNKELPMEYSVSRLYKEKA